jgi:hypothetical protein
MWIVAAASLLTIGVVAFVVFVRERDLPPPAEPSPFLHLDERKASIYENLRDLQFEYRLGKLSDDDYQHTKVDLQKELAAVLAEIDRVKAEIAPRGTVVSKAPPAKKTSGKFVCSQCGAQFSQELKFCGECGKPMRSE